MTTPLSGVTIRRHESGRYEGTVSERLRRKVSGTCNGYFNREVRPHHVRTLFAERQEKSPVDDIHGRGVAAAPAMPVLIPSGLEVEGTGARGQKESMSKSEAKQIQRSLRKRPFSLGRGLETRQHEMAEIDEAIGIGAVVEIKITSVTPAVPSPPEEKGTSKLGLIKRLSSKKKRSKADTVDVGASQSIPIIRTPSKTRSKADTFDMGSPKSSPSRKSSKKRSKEETMDILRQQSDMIITNKPKRRISGMNKVSHAQSSPVSMVINREDLLKSSKRPISHIEPINDQDSKESLILKGRKAQTMLLFLHHGQYVDMFMKGIHIRQDIVEEDYLGYATDIMEGLKLWVSILNTLLQRGITQKQLDKDDKFLATRLEHETDESASQLWHRADNKRWKRLVLNAASIARRRSQQTKIHVHRRKSSNLSERSGEGDAVPETRLEFTALCARDFNETLCYQSQFNLQKYFDHKTHHGFKLVEMIKSAGKSTRENINKVRGKLSMRDRGIFGHRISDYVREGGFPVPEEIRILVDYLRRHLDTDGLGRKSGNIHRVEALKKKVNFCKDPKALPGFIEDGFNQHDVIAVVKMWFGELVDPIFGKEACNMFVDAYRQSEHTVLDIIRDVIYVLDDAKRVALYYLVNFLRSIVAHKNVNQMNAKACAVCFAPKLFYLKNHADIQMRLQNKVYNEAFELILTNVDSLFEIKGERAYEVMELLHLQRPDSPDLEEAEGPGSPVSIPEITISEETARAHTRSHHKPKLRAKVSKEIMTEALYKAQKLTESREWNELRVDTENDVGIFFDKNPAKSDLRILDTHVGKADGLYRWRVQGTLDAPLAQVWSKLMESHWDETFTNVDTFEVVESKFYTPASLRASAKKTQHIPGVYTTPPATRRKREMSMGTSTSSSYSPKALHRSASTKSHMGRSDMSLGCSVRDKHTADLVYFKCHPVGDFKARDYTVVRSSKKLGANSICIYIQSVDTEEKLVKNVVRGNIIFRSYHLTVDPEDDNKTLAIIINQVDDMGMSREWYNHVAGPFAVLSLLTELRKAIGQPRAPSSDGSTESLGASETGDAAQAPVDV